jgi:molybdopterin biosynthesis enzyme
MVAASDTLQTIVRLTPLTEVLALIDREVRPVVPRVIEVAAAFGRVLAADVVAAAQPTAAQALIDGWALAAETTLGAGGYAPALLPHMPRRVAEGQPLPAGADSVAPLDAVQVENGRAEALEVVTQGDGVLPAGGNVDPAVPLRRAGERLRGIDLAVLASAGVARVSVREPRVRMVGMRDSATAATAGLVAKDIEARGGIVLFGESNESDADAIIRIGPAGAGAQVALTGIALTPGETAAFAFAGGQSPLPLPKRLDAALAIWLTVGRHLLSRLAAVKGDELPVVLALSRKVASRVGLAELVPVRRTGDTVEPLASRYLSLSALARSDGWILVPAESEGYSAGAAVRVWPWP